MFSLNTLTFLRKYIKLQIGLGLLLVITSALAATIFHFPYFYSSFVIGMFLFFDGIDFLLHGHTFIDYVFPMLNLKLIVVALILGWIIDFLFGQTIYKAWIYPHYHNILNQILLYVIVYPVGGLSIMSTYHVFETIFLHFSASENTSSQRISRIVNNILNTILFLFPLAIGLPVFLYVVGIFPSLVRNTILYTFFIAWIIFEWTFVFDAITARYRKKTFLLAFLSQERNIIFAIIFTGFFSGVLHEYINTSVYEWQYVTTRIPLSFVKIHNIPLVIIFGWICATILCLSLQNAFIAYKAK